MKPRRAPCRRMLVAGALALCAGAAWAGVFRHVDPVSGMVVLSNVPASVRTPVPAPAQAGGRVAGEAFPKVSSERQRQMDEERRTILQDELKEERRAHAAAAASRATGEVLARHAANIAALQRELSAVAGKRTN